MAEDRAEFEVHQYGQQIADAGGPRDRAWAAALHYAAIYGQDGPVEIYEVTRTLVYPTTHATIPLPEVEGVSSDSPDTHGHRQGRGL